MFRIDENVIGELISGITTSLFGNVVQIIMYGSQVRGDQQDGSDVDIAVILKRPMSSGEENRLSDFIVDMNLKYDTVFSVVDIEEARYLKWRSSLPFYRNVSREGRTLWTAA